MLDLTFGEQVKIILSRKGMTIKELAEMIEEHTGRKMSRQNLTQRLGRDNFQEQDMRMIASILDCPFQLTILGEHRQNSPEEQEQSVTEAELQSLARKKAKKQSHATERDITIGELVDINQGLDELLVEKEGIRLQEEMLSSQEPVNMDVSIEEPATEERMPQEESAAADRMSQEQPAAEERISEEEQASEVYVTGEEENPAEMQEEMPEEEEVQAAYTEPEEPDGAMPEELSEGQAEEAETENDTTAVSSQPEETAPSESAQEEAAEKPVKKSRGSWRDFFQRRTKKENKEPEKLREAEEPEQTDSIEESYKEETREEPGSVSEPAEPEEEMQEAFMQSLEASQEEDLEKGDVNPYTGHEYESNTVRMHPKRIGYVQVYDRSSHQWTDMTEWAFLGYQERKKALLGKDYEPPIYLD